jgi:hypothetical protein
MPPDSATNPPFYSKRFAGAQICISQDCEKQGHDKPTSARRLPGGASERLQTTVCAHSSPCRCSCDVFCIAESPIDRTTAPFRRRGRTIFLHHNHRKDKLAQRASVKALANGVINERSKYRQEERREGGLLQFQDKQSVRMATRGDHLHYSKQKPGTEPQQNVYEQIDDPCAARGQKNQLLELSRVLCRRI